MDHVLLLENGLSPPKLLVKLPRNRPVAGLWASIPDGNVTEQKSKEKCNDLILKEGSTSSDNQVNKHIQNDMSEIKKLLHTVIKENRQLKETCIDLHNEDRKIIEDIDRKVSWFSAHEEQQTVHEVMEEEECAEESLNNDSFSIEKSDEIVSSKPSEEHTFDLNSMSEFFPLTSHLEILSFENRVRQDSDFKEKMIKTLYQVGGENARTACRKLAKSMFTDEILMEYSYEGAQSKKKFKEYKEIIEIIFLAVYNRFEEYTMEQHKSGISDHLRYASSRLKKRKNSILSKLGSISKKSKHN